MSATEEYDGPIPDIREQEWEFVEEPEDQVVYDYQRGQTALEVRQEGRRGAWIASNCVMEIKR